MAESYEVTVKVRVTAPNKRSFGDDDHARAAWALEGSQIVAAGIELKVAPYYREMGAKFEVVSSSAIPTTVVGVD